MTDENLGEGSASGWVSGMMGCPCNTCAHVYPGMSYCEAFQDGESIPANIMTGRNNHLTGVAGDHGLHYVYDPACGLPKPSWGP